MMALPAEFKKRGGDTSQSSTFSSSNRKVLSYHFMEMHERLFEPPRRLYIIDDDITLNSGT